MAGGQFPLTAPPPQFSVVQWLPQCHRHAPQYTRFSRSKAGTPFGPGVSACPERISIEAMLSGPSTYSIRRHAGFSEQFSNAIQVRWV